MSKKERLHQLVDELPEVEVEFIERVLEQVRDHGHLDPLLRALFTAPYDDEPETTEERAAVEEARAERDRGEMMPDAEVWRRLGHEPRR